MSKIAVAKGIVQKKVIEIVAKKYGLEIDQKKLCLHVGEDTIFFVKHRDIPELVENEYVDIGITSEEWIVEKEVEVDIIREEEWCNTKICIIGNRKTNYRDGKTICATEFPNISKKYFNEMGLDVDVRKISGSSEAYVPLLADICVDCVETGKTLQENNLNIITTILKSKIVVFVKKGHKKEFEKCIEELFDNE